MESVSFQRSCTYPQAISCTSEVTSQEQPDLALTHLLTASPTQSLKPVTMATLFCLLPGAYDGRFFQLNFQGKTIHLKSLNGALRTYIVTSNASVFVFNSGESWDTIIEGVSFKNFYEQLHEHFCTSHFDPEFVSNVQKLFIFLHHTAYSPINLL